MLLWLYLLSYYTSAIRRFFLITEVTENFPKKTVCQGVIITSFRSLPLANVDISFEERSCMRNEGGIMRRNTKFGYDDFIWYLPLKKDAFRPQKRPGIVCPSGWWITWEWEFMKNIVLRFMVNPDEIILLPVIGRKAKEMPISSLSFWQFLPWVNYLPFIAI